MLSDFLLFCKLASARGVAPASSWGWGATLEAAGWMLDKGFRPEQCGADLRYGPRAAGGALRQLASRVYEGRSGGGGGGGGGGSSDSGSAASDDEGDSSEGEASAKESPFLRGISLGGTQRRQRHAKDKGSRGARGGGGSGAKGDTLAEETGARIASACAGDDSVDDEGFARHSFTFERESGIFDDVRQLVGSGLLLGSGLLAWPLSSATACYLDLLRLRLQAPGCATRSARAMELCRAHWRLRALRCLLRSCNPAEAADLADLHMHMQVGGVELWKELNEQLKIGRLGSGLGAMKAGVAAGAATGSKSGPGKGIPELGSGFGSGPDAATKLALQSGMGFDSVRR